MIASAHRPFIAIATGLALVATLIGFSTPASAASSARYLVLTTTEQAATQLAFRAHTPGSPVHRFTGVVDGFSAQLTSTQVESLRRDDRVAEVRRENVYAAQATQKTPGWGLDRIDQRGEALNAKYGYQTSGKGVTTYVVDTGVRLDHEDFGDRARSGYDFVDEDPDATDCNGHGTHVAGLLAGTTFGVAKGAKVVALRVLDCDGFGWESYLINSLQWILDHRPTGRAVVNISISGQASEQVDALVSALVAAGLPVVVAAGNYDPTDPAADADACNASPGRVADAITVAATTRSDARAAFSKYGPCVDVFAPGEDIWSAGLFSTSATDIRSGTSQASPAVAGAVARHLQGHPKATPAQIRSALVADATAGAVADLQGSPDRMLFVRTADSGAPASVTGSASGRTLTLRWKEPAGFGTWSVTRYQVVRSGRDRYGKVFKTKSLTSSTRSYAFKNLKRGSSYTVKVRAINAGGPGAYAAKKVRVPSGS